MSITPNQLPSFSRAIEWHWKLSTKEKIDYKKIAIAGEQINFVAPMAYIPIPEKQADEIAFIGRNYTFLDQTVAMPEVEIQITEGFDSKSQIGSLLTRMSRKRVEAEPYSMHVKFKFINKSAYCYIAVLLVDNDIGTEIDVAVMEIGYDEDLYILPVVIDEFAMNYFEYDDIAELTYWLKDLWVGVQYELSNPYEEIREVEQRGPITGSNENYNTGKRFNLVKSIIPVDTEGNIIQYGRTGSGRQYRTPVWPVRGYYRRSKNGKVTFVSPHKKGKERNNPSVCVSKEYRFVEEKIEQDADVQEQKNNNT